MTIADGFAEVAAGHRERWLAARHGDRSPLRLESATDPARAVREASAGGEPGVVAWLRDVPAAGPECELADALADAVRAGWGVAVAIPGDATDLPRSERPRDAEPAAVAAALAARLEGARVVEQRLAEASIIADGPGLLTGALADGEPAGGVYARLVVAGLPEPGSDGIDFSAATINRSYLLWLDAANAELRRANTLLARAQLGKYDSAAGWFVNRLEHAQDEAERLAGLLEIEKQVAAQNHEYFDNARRKLHEPHHRIAEGIVRRASRLPGARAIGGAISRRMLPPGQG